MKKINLIKIFAGILFPVIIMSCTQKQTDPSIVRSNKYNESLKKAYKQLGLFYTTSNIPALTVAVSIDNQVVWADGIGYSSLEVKNLLKSDYPPPEEVALTPIFASHRKFLLAHRLYGQSPVKT